MDKNVRQAHETNKPIIYHCCCGLLSFVVPFHIHDTPLALVGGGVREASIDFWKLEELAGSYQISLFSLLEKLDVLPIATMQEVENAAIKIQQMIPALLGDVHYKQLFDTTLDRISTISGMLSRIDREKTDSGVLQLSSEVMAILFNIPKIAVVRRAGHDGICVVQGTWGTLDLPDQLSQEAFMVLAPPPQEKFLLLQAKIGELFPSLEANRGISLPLSTVDEHLGFLVLFDWEVAPTDLVLLELIAGRVGAKLLALKQESEYLEGMSLTNRLMSMAGTRVLPEHREELYRDILEIAADLVGATRGSVMLLDKSGENLRIEYTKGMNLQLAQTLNVRVGEGIAGKVARSGQPLLVRDIETDNRLGMRNRPRFKTKSLISIPLILNEDVIGVLNLSDKDDSGMFTDGDMEMLTTFAGHASLLIERIRALEKTHRLEQLSVTDPLTELYNRRYLKTRLEEELNRSIRHGLNLTVLFIDLDHFKIYNDLCGHLGGDEALRKAAHIIKAAVREMDIVARYGGEEFCVIVPGATKQESTIVAERIRYDMEQAHFAREEHLPLGRLTASIGIASFPQDGKSYTALVHSADMALYQAKAEGRNRIIRFSESSGRAQLPVHI